MDVDKLYIMLPEFNIRTHNMGEARRDFLKANEGISKLLGTLIGDEDTIESKEEFKEFFNQNKDRYKLNEPQIYKVKYDTSKQPKDNSLAQRNNMLIDLMWGVLTNLDTASKILNPGGFDGIKKAARIITILQNAKESDLAEQLNLQRGEKIINKLNQLSLKELTKMFESYKEVMDPLSPMTQIELQQQNMAGAQMIGIYANHNANHAITQHTGLTINEKNGGFTLGGKMLLHLNKVLAPDKKYISKSTAEYLAASVDNVKDPVLKYLNGNPFTGDAQMLLSRLGYDALSINLLMTQPIVLEITEAYFRQARLGKGKATIISEIVKEYSKKGQLMSNLGYDNFKDNRFLVEDLAENILIAKDMEGIDNISQTDDYRKVQFYKGQAAVGYLFSRIMKTAESLGDFVATTRSDTQGGAAGPTIADTELKLQRIKDFYKKATEDLNFPLINAAVIDPELVWSGNEDQMRETFMKSNLPYMQAFYSLGVKSSEQMLGRYFPQFKNDFREVIDTLRSMTKGNKLDVKTMNSVYNDLFAYILNKTDFLGDSDNATSFEKRSSFINDFPNEFKRIISENPDIASLEFIKRIKWQKPNDQNAVPTIQFRNVGHLTPILKDRYMRDWANLLYMGEEGQNLALNLFRYSYYKNGFAFGSDSFMHLAPTLLRKVVPEYLDSLRDVMDSEDDYLDFVDQYIYNHPDNRKLVPEIPQDSSIEFIKGNEIQDTIAVVIDDNSTSANKKVIIDSQQLDVNHTRYKFADFITHRQGKSFIYYRRQRDSTTTDNSAIYNRFEPLGIQKGFLQYEYGVDAEDIEQAVIPKTYSRDTGFIEQSDADISEGGMFSEEESSQIYDRDALAQSYQEVYGIAAESEVKQDIMREPSADNFKDANDLPLC